MANCSIYACDDLGTYESSIANCGSKIRKSGAATMYLLECGYEPNDPGDEAELDQAVADGDAYKITNVKIGFSQPSEITEDAITSCGTTVTVDYDRQVNIEDYKVTALNTAFWNSASNRPFGGMVLVECETEGLDPLVSYIDKEITISFYRDFPNVSSSPQKYIITAKYKSYSDPQSIEFTPA